ncbi:MAG: hypothetical protein PHS96_14170 [Anaerolineales bacterium]|nr:hypothetical protein [Anaerolineales bacterium]
MESEALTPAPARARRIYPAHGWLGLGLAMVFWALNWTLSGLRTHWGFFPMWLGYCLAVDGLVYLRRGSSLLIRSRWRYVGLFLVSAPAWWLFEALNLRLGNWEYLGSELFTPLQYWAWASLSFTTVIPAVFGAAELAASFNFVRKLRPGPRLPTSKRAVLGFFLAGAAMLALLLAWPRLFFPFAWVSVYFLMEPLNIWLGRPNLARWTQRGDWRPVVALWVGALLTAFFWEMWNYFSYPKWVYHVPGVDWLHVFEMPVLGYGGYLPFALELHALYALVCGLVGDKESHYLRLDFDG